MNNFEENDKNVIMRIKGAKFDTNGTFMLNDACFNDKSQDCEKLEEGIMGIAKFLQFKDAKPYTGHTF